MDTTADSANPGKDINQSGSQNAEDTRSSSQGETNNGEINTAGTTSKKDYARMRRIAGWHGSAVLAALTLWGFGNYWAMQSSLIIALIVSLGNAFVAATVIASIFHEWGHFAGAKLSGSIAPVRAKPARFYFMFNFDMQANDVKQFQWMSIGGIAANWLLVLLMLLLIPLNTWSGALLLATAIGRAVNVSVFEVPIVLRSRESGNPEKELQDQLDNAGLQQIPGLIVGALAWLALT